MRLGGTQVKDELRAHQKDRSPFLFRDERSVLVQQIEAKKQEEANNKQAINMKTTGMI